MQHIWSVLSKKSIIDSISNTISILEVIDEIKVDITLPKNLNELKNITIPLEFELTSLWYRDNDNGEYPFNFRIELFDPSSNKINTFENVLTFPKGKKRLRSQSRIQGFPINDTGVYKLSIGFKDKKMEEFQNVTDIPIDIVINKKNSEEIQLLENKVSL